MEDKTQNVTVSREVKCYGIVAMYHNYTIVFRVYGYFTNTETNLYLK